MAADSTLRTYPVGGQLDPAWLASAIPWTHVRATAILSRPDAGAPVVDPTNGAHEHPLTVVNTLTAAAADGQWATAPLKPTTSTGADLALAPSGLTWEITLEIKRGATWHEVISYTVAPSGDRDYDGEGKLITVDGDDCIDINALIPPPAAIPPGELFSDAVLEVLTDNPAAIAADLSVTRTGTTVTVASSTGTDATLPAATTSLAGQLTAADKAKLDGIEAGAQANVATDLSVTRDGTTVTVTSSTGADVAIPAATSSLAGVFPAADKAALDRSRIGRVYTIGGHGVTLPEGEPVEADYTTMADFNTADPVPPGTDEIRVAGWPITDATMVCDGVLVGTAVKWIARTTGNRRITSVGQQALVDAPGSWIASADGWPQAPSLPNRADKTTTATITGTPAWVIGPPSNYFLSTAQSIQFPTSSTPTFTATTGDFAYLAVISRASLPGTGQFPTVLSAESASNAGVRLFLNATNGDLAGQVNSLFFGGVGTAGTGRKVVGIKIGSGAARVYLGGVGFGTTTSITGVGAITFSVNAQIGGRAFDGGSPLAGSFETARIWTTPISDSVFVSAADALAAGDYGFF